MAFSSSLRSSAVWSLSFLGALCLSESSAKAENLLRNGSFEKPSVFNGAPMRQGDEKVYVGRVEKGLLSALPLEGWLAEGSSAAGASLEKGRGKSGETALRLAPDGGKALAIFSVPESKVEAGPLVFSVWVLPKGASLSLELEFLERPKDDSIPNRSLSRKSLRLPAGASGWTRLELAAAAPENACVRAGIKISEGEALVDCAQLERGEKAEPFDLRPDEALELSFKGEDPARLPFWSAKDGSPLSLLARNASCRELSGALELWLGPWSKPKSLRVANLPASRLKAGESIELPLSSVAELRLRPDAYAVFASLRKGETCEFDGESQIDANVPIGGVSSNHMLKGRGAIRFGVFPDLEPKKIFGVGNGKLGNGWQGCEGDWRNGWPLSLFEKARPNGFSCGRGRMSAPDQAYLFAAAGVPFHRMESVSVFYGAPKNAPFLVPGTKDGVDLWNPEGFAFNLKRAEQVGKENAANPGVVSCQMANEVFFALKNGLCPTKSADLAFREWCEAKHGSLESLNAKWRTACKSWDEIEQPLSAKFADEMGKAPEQSGADWLSAFGRLPPEVLKRMSEPAGRGMDWLRWRTASSLRFYAAFKDEAKRHDGKTLYSTNLCWPNFRPQMFMPFLREMDHALLDIQYTAGMSGLGNPKEMLEIQEMAESCSSGKPLWGAEIYVQPDFPPEFAALQNWGVLAHGMSNSIVFAWGPSSDHGIPKKARAWEDKKSFPHPMWMLIDWDGSKLPAYHSCQRSLEEIKAFNAKYDAAALKRRKADVALYVSNDTAEYVCYETGDKPWSSLWTRTRSTLAFLLRMEGVRFDMVDDATLPASPGAYSALIVPASYMLNQEAAGRIASFAKGGGTVVLAGLSGAVDPWLAKYENLGGPAWEELGWRAPGFAAEPASFNFVGASYKPAKRIDAKLNPDEVDEPDIFKGSGFGSIESAENLYDSAGKLAGWTRKWGAGRLVAYGAVPDSYSANPHPSKNHLAWLKQLMEKSGLAASARWVANGAPSSAGFAGEGLPQVEIVERERQELAKSERFVFVLNQGGAGAGVVELSLPPGTWRVSDAISGKQVASEFRNGTLLIGLDLKAWGYRVFRIEKKG